jgi:microcystin-dependent protein
MKRYLIGISCIATMAMAGPAQAQDRVLGEIFMTGYNFCPRNTMSAEGQILPISQHSALFSLLGTIYGGDGRTSFALPDLRGRSPLGQGTGFGLTPHPQGEKGGRETMALQLAELPTHRHNARVRASSSAPNTPSPEDRNFATFPAEQDAYTNGAQDVFMGTNDVQVQAAGEGLPFSLHDPFLAVRYCVVMEGLFPSRN